MSKGRGKIRRSFSRNQEKKEMTKLWVSLSSETCMRSRKRPNNVHKAVDNFFLGLWLIETTTDSYRTVDPPVKVRFHYYVSTAAVHNLEFVGGSPAGVGFPHVYLSSIVHRRCMHLMFILGFWEHMLVVGDADFSGFGEFLHVK